jgi:methyltransferase (TIGR00027 family)
VQLGLACTWRIIGLQQEKGDGSGKPEPHSDPYCNSPRCALSHRRSTQNPCRFARAFAGFSSDNELLAATEANAFPDFVAHRTFFALRNRYAEDQLAAAVASGTAQYVILGAGLDSFAYRRPDALREVDHPSTQAWKQARLGELAIEAPPSLRFVPIDFERETLTAGLDAGGVDRKAKAFFSWLGVTQYLTRDAILKTLREIASATVAGSGIVATYVVPASTLNRAESEVVAALTARTASVGEPWLSFFEPGEMIALMQQAGFVDVSCFGPEDAARTYLAGRRDGLRMPAHARLIRGCVG